jgi:hypothetical protein
MGSKVEAPASLVRVLEEARELVCDASGNVRDLLKDDDREATPTSIIIYYIQNLQAMRTCSCIARGWTMDETLESIYSLRQDQKRKKVDENDDDVDISNKTDSSSEKKSRI